MLQVSFLSLWARIKRQFFPRQIYPSAARLRAVTHRHRKSLESIREIGRIAGRLRRIDRGDNGKKSKQKKTKKKTADEK